VDHDRVAAAGVLEQSGEAFAVDGGAGFLVDVDPVVEAACESLVIGVL
jgi:hypothetical protein